jgi:hypothetical protein
MSQEMDMPTATRTLRQCAALTAVALAAFTAACGPASQAESSTEALHLDFARAALVKDNGLSQNGLSQNGLSQNGLGQNGLSQNGLSQNGFKTWFNQNLASSDAVMKYLYACAAPAGWTLTWTNPTTGVPHGWAGVFGLASDWASGKPATAAERQVISACLAAHVNAYGMSVPISLSGYAATGTLIPHTSDEWSAFPIEEGVFFGDIFGTQGAFVCQMHAPYTAAQSSSRACAFDTSVAGPSADCAPMVNVGDCSAVCSGWKAKDHAYQKCTWNGVVYNKPITTRIQSQDLFSCGDGVCQFTEHCGTGTTADSCRADCGVCQ